MENLETKLKKWEHTRSKLEVDIKSNESELIILQDKIDTQKTEINELLGTTDITELDELRSKLFYTISDLEKQLDAITGP